MQVLICSIGSQVCGMLVAGGFCYGRLLDESCIARESQNSPAPARASDRLLSIWSGCVLNRQPLSAQRRTLRRLEGAQLHLR